MNGEDLLSNIISANLITEEQKAWNIIKVAELNNFEIGKDQASDDNAIEQYYQNLYPKLLHEEIQKVNNENFIKINASTLPITMLYFNPETVKSSKYEDIIDAHKYIIKLWFQGFVEKSKAKKMNKTDKLEVHTIDNMFYNHYFSISKSYNLISSSITSEASKNDAQKIQTNLTKLYNTVLHYEVDSNKGSFEEIYRFEVPKNIQTLLYSGKSKSATVDPAMKDEYDKLKTTISELQTIINSTKTTFVAFQNLFEKITKNPAFIPLSAFKPPLDAQIKTFDNYIKQIDSKLK
jgi:hypothetical protein